MDFDDWSVSHSETMCPWHVILSQDPTWWKMDERQNKHLKETSHNTGVYIAIQATILPTIQPGFSLQKNPQMFSKLSFRTQRAIANVKWSCVFSETVVGQSSTSELVVEPPNWKILIKLDHVP